jgi:hypothetical protein
MELRFRLERDVSGLIVDGELDLVEAERRPAGRPVGVEADRGGREKKSSSGGENVTGSPRSLSLSLSFFLCLLPLLLLLLLLLPSPTLSEPVVVDAEPPPQWPMNHQFARFRL